jgi:prevent-host-death family protein
MASIYNMHEAKTQFSKLVEKARLGEDVVVAKAGKPVVKLVPIEAEHMPRKPGSARGMFTMSDDFDAPLPDDLLDEFYK